MCSKNAGIAMVRDLVFRSLNPWAGTRGSDSASERLYLLNDLRLRVSATPECILILMPSIQNGLQATFQIGELAKRTALSIDAIRFYERRKLVPPASRSAGRFRLYTPDAIERLRFVRRMQGLGFSLQEIKELMGVRADRAHA